MDPAIVQKIMTAAPVGLLLGLLGFLIAWLPRGASLGRGVVVGERHPLDDRLFVGPLVLGLASIVAHQLVSRSDDGGMPSLLPGASFLTWWPAISLVALLLGLASALLATPGAIRWALRLALFAGVAFVSARGQITQRWDAGTSAAILVGFATVAWLMIAGLERGARPVQTQGQANIAGGSAGWMGVLPAFITAFSVSQVLIIGFKVQSPAFVVLALCAALGVALALSLLRSRLTLAHGTMTTLGALLATTLMQAALFGQAKDQHAAMYIGLLLLGVWGPTLVDALNLPLKGWKLGLVRSAGAAPALLAVAAAVVISPPPT